MGVKEEMREEKREESIHVLVHSPNAPGAGLKNSLGMSRECRDQPGIHHLLPPRVLISRKLDQK